MLDIRNNKLIFVICLLFGGSGWVCMPLQIVNVPLEISVSYRFFIASLVLFLVAYLKDRKFPSVSSRVHYSMIIQGAMLFSINYMLVYAAAQYIVTGLIAISVSTMIIPNMILGSLFLGKPIKKHMVLGAFLGIMGVICLFWEDFLSFDTTNYGVIGFSLAFISTFFSSVGTIISGRIQKGIPVLWNTAYAMGYGSVISMMFALFRGHAITFDFSWAYILSLLYLSIFVSAVVFVFYLTLTIRVGPGKAAYLWIVTPLISLNISAFFEDFVWGLNSFLGAGLIIFGGVLALQRIPSVFDPPLERRKTMSEV